MNLLRRKIRRAAIACLSLTLCTSLTASCAMINIDNKPQEPSTTVNSMQFTEVTDKYDTTDLSLENFNSSVLPGEKSYETRTVIVYLNGDSVLDVIGDNQSVAEYMSTTEGRAHLRTIDREQKTFLNKLDSQGISYKLKSTYSTITNAVAVEVNTSYVKRIKSFGGVQSAVIGNTYLAPKTVETQSSSGLPENDANVNPTGIYKTDAVDGYTTWGKGQGMVVAILDTGLDYTHNAFHEIPAVQSMQLNDVSAVLANTEAYKRISALNGTLTADNLYVSGKVPFAFDYADDDADVYPSYSNHGTHVAGIIGGYDEDGYDDKDGNHIDETFTGVAPQAQLVICKTFTDNLDDTALGGAESKDIMSALEDCVILGVDVINMSLGTTAGFTTTDDGDDEGDHFNRIFESIRNTGISLICAASNDYSAGFGSIYGTNLASNPDSGTVGSPSTYYAALSVASISGQEAQYLEASDGTPIFIENSTNGNGVDYDFVKDILGGETEKELEYVVVGSGQQSNYSGVSELIKGKIALVKRGINTFQEKVEIAINAGAIGVIIWNNVSGTVRMSLGDIPVEKLKPTVSVTMDAGNKLVELARSGERGIVGKIKVNKTNEAGPFMSGFSSWGTTSDLKIKPEITAHGGEITSTVPGGYAEQSGTSMASPNMAGLTALVRNYIVNEHKAFVTDDGTVTGNVVYSKVTQLANQLIMSTATTVYDQSNLAYSPRKQGAGLANLINIVNTNAYLFTDVESDGTLYYAGKDGRPKIELGQDLNPAYDKTNPKKAHMGLGEYTFSFKIKNFGGDALSFTPQSLMMTETIDSTGVAVAEKAHMLTDIAPVFTVGTNKTPVTDKITVAAGTTELITVTLKLSDPEKTYIDDNFVNGMFVEGFIKLVGEDGQCDLNLPFMSFYGDWSQAPMLDYSAYEIAANQQDSSVLEEEKIKETVWATQPYGSYNEDNFVIPMGSYVYTQPDGADEMYANEQYCSLSRFNEIVSEDGRGNYTTVYELRCLYAGLLRNAQQVNYKLYDAYTGELVYSDVNYRISKAYANGGTSRPAYIEMKLSPEEMGLKSNGKYRFDFEFLFNKNETPKAENTYSFEFYVDYEAPVLSDARLRYYNTTDEQGRDAQRIYIDLDVFDNHYPQSVKLCYIDTTDMEKQELKLATDYVTPVRNPNRNGITTVSIEVTDIWDEYKDLLAVELDDYALNHSSYILANRVSGTSIETSLNRTSLPDTFELAEGEENITLNINQMHKASLVYEGSADLSNFEWSSPSHYIAVKNGEIVGLECTNGKSYPVFVNNRKGVSKTINVTVTNSTSSIRGLSFGFGVIRNYNEALVKAEGTVQVYAGEDINLEVEATPWYFSGDLNVTWSTNREEIATVDENGKVHTKKKGTATITAQIEVNGIKYAPAVVTFSVQDEFTVSNMALTRYRGEGETYVNPKGVPEENVVIVPSDKQIMTIGEEAFKDNKKIKKIIIPKTVTTIERGAFKGCTALEKVYFMSDDEAEYDKTINPTFVPDADLTLINRNAFEGCENLELLDLRYTKVFSLGREAFKDCKNLKTIVKSTAIGTAYDRAFMGCSSLEEIDISGLHVAGANVFSGCTKLNNVTTDTFTAISRGMFSNLHYIYPEYNYSNGEWEIKDTDYEACTSLANITLKCSSIGNGAFENCENLATVNFENGVKTIGARAFANTNINSVTLPASLESIGAGAFEGTSVAYGTGVINNAVINGDTLIKYFGNSASVNLSTWSGVTKIAPYAFANNNTLTSVTIPSTVTEIGEGAFYGCENLDTVTFNGNTLNYISPYAFYNTAIESITLPDSVFEVGDYAFALSKINEFNFTPAADDVVFGNGVFYRCTELVNIELDAKITQMGDVTFAACSSLATVKMPAVTSLGANTFYRTPELTKVEFAAGATVTGIYTFAADYAADRAKLVEVSLGNSLKEIGEFAFYNCVNLGAINLNGATVIGNYAFYNNNKLATVGGLSDAVKIGDYAFANCNALTALKLTNAQEIGAGAFRIDEGRAYTSLEIPAAVKIGDFAFLGGNESALVIPASLKEIGSGAFAASSSLKAFTVAEGNKYFFVNDGVLYRNIKNGVIIDGEEQNAGYYGLVAYPSEKAADTYTVLDDTARIDGGAFYGLHAKVNKVVLPYSLKSVGAMAFFQSGIKEYEFIGVTAPALETDYSLLVNDFADANNINFRGYYYANFENYFIYYSEYGSGVAVTPLTISRPSNGTGYDNQIYSQYFANENLTGIALDANAYDFVQFVDSCPTATEISGWTTSNKSEQEVKNFAALVKRAHEYYDNFSSDEAQLELVGNERIEKFNAIEAAMREVKPRFGISVRVTRLRASGDYRTEYRVGEKFDMTGLVIILIYDDYSTATADMSRITVESPTGALELLDNEVILSGYGRTLSIRIYVTENGPGSNCAAGCGSVDSMGGTMFITLTAIGALLLTTTIARKKSRGCK